MIEFRCPKCKQIMLRTADRIHVCLECGYVSKPEPEDYYPVLPMSLRSDVKGEIVVRVDLRGSW